MVTSCSGSGGRAGFAQPASRVNLSRLLLLSWLAGSDLSISQDSSGTNIGNLSQLTVDTQNHHKPPCHDLTCATNHFWIT